MKKKLSALLLSAILCATAMPVTGMAAEFSDDTAVETSEEDAAETSEEISGQEEVSLEVSDDTEIPDYEDETEELSIGDIEQAYAGSNSSSDDFTDTDDFSDGKVPENGNLTLSHEGIIQEGAICPKKTSAVLTDKWEKALVNLVESGSSVLNIASLSIPADQISDIIMLFINQHPEYYWLSFESCDVENGIAVTLYEDVKPSMAKAGNSVYGSASLETAAEDALSVIKPEMSDLEKALALHDYLALHTKYAYEDSVNNSLSSSVYTAEGALVNGNAVCQGYALAYQYLLGKVGIESKYVASSAMNHGWNLVKINGQWYHVDVTWDDPAWDQIGRVRHQYFMLSDSAIIRLDHYNWKAWNNETETIPAAVSETYSNFFWKNIDTGIWYYQGKWYYMETNDTIGQLKCQKSLDSSASVLMTVDMEWPYVGKPNYYWGNSAKTVLYNGQFYYSGPDALYRVNLDGSGNTKVADVKYTNQYVYGFAYSNGSFWIALHDTPNISTAESPMKITLGAESKPTVEPKPTTAAKLIANTLKVSNVKRTQSTKKQNFSLNAKVLGNAKLTYRSNNKNITVDKNGKVSISANFTGEASITVSAAATSKYKAAKKTVTITVNPSAVSITKCTNIKTRKADIRWKKNSSATGYEVQYSTSKTFKSGVKTKALTKPSTIKYTAAGLASKKTYYVRVRAYKTVGKKKLYSSWSGIKTVKITK